MEISGSRHDSGGEARRHALGGLCEVHRGAKPSEAASGFAWAGCGKEEVGGRAVPVGFPILDPLIFFDV